MPSYFDYGATSRGLGNVTGRPTTNPLLAQTAPVSYLNTNRPAYQPQASPTAASPSGWQQTNDFLKSPLGQLAVGGVSTGINNYVASKNRQEDREASAAESEANRAQQAEIAKNSLLANLSSQLMADQRDRAAAAVRPLGDASTFATSAAKRSAIADLLGGPQLSSGISYVPKANMPSVSGGVLDRIRAANSAESVASGLARQDMDLSRLDPGRTSSLATEASTLTGLRPSSPFLASLLQQAGRAQAGAQSELGDTQNYARMMLQQAMQGTAQAPTTTGPGGGSAVRPFRHSRVR